MTRQVGRRAGVVAGVVALASTLFAVGAEPGGAATKNPCKVLTKSEIQSAFGGTVNRSVADFAPDVYPQTTCLPPIVSAGSFRSKAVPGPGSEMPLQVNRSPRTNFTQRPSWRNTMDSSARLRLAGS